MREEFAVRAWGYSKQFQGSQSQPHIA
jgi:hypothetical protein